MGHAYAFIGVLLNNGSGEFPTYTQYDVGSIWFADPYTIAVGRFDNDAIIDLIVANYGTNELSFFKGNGNGTFQSQVITYGISSPLAQIAKDFNGDNKLDLLLTIQPEHKVRVLLGNGDGTFSFGQEYNVGTFPTFSAAGDFNKDSKWDFVVGNVGSHNLSVMFGNGDGTFSNHLVLPVGLNPQGVVVGDFDLDNNDDIAVTNVSSNSVSVILSNGNETFQSKVDFPVGTTPVLMVSGYFNGDNKLDFGVIHGSQKLFILINNTIIEKTSYELIHETKILLSPYLTNSDKKIREAIAEVIKHIDKSLGTELWEDGNHLTFKGNQVFNSIKVAIKELSVKIIKKYSGAVAVDAASAISSMVTAAEKLAQNSINEVVCNGDQQCILNLQKALDEMSLALAELGFLNYEKSIDHFSKAWVFSQIAMKKAVQKSPDENNYSSTYVPEEFNLLQNYPNPFNPSTRISFDLPEASVVTLKIYNMLGQEVASLISDELYRAGSHEKVFDASGYPSGVYIYRISANNYSVQRKMILAK
ncbi:MAG: T9SS type A sorting domain-containing protein [Ignavibacteria bacterium]|nr:T9SS type A sorting domain-containing protein [Ignavibacteria bacterium]